MKSQIDLFLSTLTRPPQLRRSDILITLISAALWILEISARPILIKPYCTSSPSSCSHDSVPTIDRLSLGMESEKADLYSYYTQNLSGALAVFIPTFWNLGTWVFQGTSASAALAHTGTDLLLFAETATVNGMLTEASHLVTGRPRPFVYSDPISRGNDPAHYTSFYSGHTSFVTAASLCLFLTLLGRKAAFPLLLFIGASSQTLIFITAFCRALAGRHFVTDVVAAQIAGAFVAVGLVYRNRKNGPGIASQNS